jgi:hypothetical protein
MTTLQVCRVAATGLAIALAGLVMTACAGGTAQGGDGLTGVFGGDAALEGGCAWLDVDGDRWEVLYPDGYTVAFDPVRLIGPDGQVVAEAGSTLRVRGAEATDAVSVCQVGRLWQATDVTVQ